MADDDRPSPTPTQPPFEPEDPFLTDESSSRRVNVPVQTTEREEEPVKKKSLILSPENPDEALMNTPGPSGYRAPTATISSNFPPIKWFLRSHQRQSPTKEQQQQPPSQQNVPGPTSCRVSTATIPPAATNKGKRIVTPPKKRPEFRQQQPPPEQQQQPPTQRGNAASSSGKRKRPAYPKKERQGTKTSVRDRREIAECYFSNPSTAKQIIEERNLSTPRFYQIIQQEVKKDPSLLTIQRTMTTRASAALPQQHQPPPEQQHQPPPEQQHQPPPEQQHQPPPEQQHQPPPERQQQQPPLQRQQQQPPLQRQQQQPPLQRQQQQPPLQRQQQHPPLQRQQQQPPPQRQQQQQQRPSKRQKKQPPS